MTERLGKQLFRSIGWAVPTRAQHVGTAHPSVIERAGEQLFSQSCGRTEELLPVSSDFLFLHQAGKMIEGPIISSFGLPWKTTAWQLAPLQVILQALTADALSGAGIVAAIALLKIFFFFALHQPAPNEPLVTFLFSRQNCQQPGAKNRPIQGNC